VADAAAHEKEDDRLGLGFRQQGVGDLAVLCPQAAHGDAEEAAAELVQEGAPLDSAARV